MPRLGHKVDMGKAKNGAPPIVFAVQPTGFLPVNTPEELKEWEEDLKSFYGIPVEARSIMGAASESCSCGCSDDCDLCQR